MANQDSVVRASIASLLPFVSVPVLNASPSPERVTTAMPHGTTRGAGLNEFVRHSIAFATKPMPADVVRALTRYVGTETCAVSGTVTVTLDDNDESGSLSAGDSLTVAYVQCSEVAGSSVNGVMGMSLATVSISPTMQDITGAMSFQSLAMLDQGAGLTLNGGVGFRLTDTLLTNGIDSLGTYTVSGGLTAVATGGLADTFSYRVGYSVTERDFAPNMPGIATTEANSASGRFGSAALGGDLDLATLQPFKSSYITTEGDVYPTEGQMTATGLDNTRVSLTATKTSQVRMDVCDDGDGEWEATKMVDWDWLLP
ncbi:MAG: hypothetical protein U5L03_14110 [Burkholderiaceae bacterium]|nr:hypothetical protein [Burkholderiaceae bacterium]